MCWGELLESERSCMVVIVTESVMDQGFVGYLETKRDGLRRQVKQSLQEQKMNREDPQSVRLVYRGVAYSPVR